MATSSSSAVRSRFESLRAPSARRRLVREALPIAGLVGIAGAVYARSIHTRVNFDEGVYLASLDALRHGQALGTDVDIPQPPGFYVLLQAFGSIFGNSVTGVRVGFLLVALAGLSVAYLLGRSLAGGWGGLGAAVLLAIAHPYPTLAAQVEADTVSTVLALGSVFLLIYGRGRALPAAASGAVVAAAFSVKLLAAPVVAPLAVLLLARRSARQTGAFLGGAVLVGAILLIRYAYALGPLYQSVVVEHRNAQALGSFSDNLDRVLGHPLDWRTPAGVLIPIGLVLALFLARRVETAALAAWIVASAAFLIYQRPLLDHHMVLLVTALAVTAGAGLGAAASRLQPRMALAAAVPLALAVAAGFVQEERRLARNAVPEPREVRWAVSQLRARTNPDELIATDLPIVPYLARRRVAGQLIDASYGRLLSNTLTTQEILTELEEKRIRTVLVARNYQLKPDLIAALRARYPRLARYDSFTLYVR